MLEWNIKHITKCLSLNFVFMLLNRATHLRTGTFTNYLSTQGIENAFYVCMSLFCTNQVDKCFLLCSTSPLLFLIQISSTPCNLLKKKLSLLYNFLTINRIQQIYKLIVQSQNTRPNTKGCISCVEIFSLKYC